MGLALLPFFEWYKPDVPHRMAAIKQLEEAMPEHLLSEDAEWFQAWKASGIDQEVYCLAISDNLICPAVKENASRHRPR